MEYNFEKRENPDYKREKKETARFLRKIGQGPFTYTSLGLTQASIMRPDMLHNANEIYETS